MTDIRGQSLQELMEELDRAIWQYQEAQKSASLARNTEVDKLNALNKIQKQIDQYMRNCATHAPPGSDWADKIMAR
uniref:Uncharacterized protein n=1 Tax=viral metagenome TaxID=1070528 RepID=A0A6M3KXF3_9ZZZZ